MQEPTHSKHPEESMITLSNRNGMAIPTQSKLSQEVSKRLVNGLYITPIDSSYK